MPSKQKKIIIAEDEPTLIEMYRLYFERAGYQVLGADNGKECVDIAKKEKPNLILLDIVMPKMDGWQTLTTLKSDPETKQIPVLVFSNLGQTQEIQKGLELGADDYVVKSDMTPKELLEKVEQMLLKSDTDTRIPPG